MFFFCLICKSNFLLDEDGRDHGVAVGTDGFPASLDIMNLMGSQFGLGISQIFRFSLSF
jgi:hypothetical protein